MGRKKMDITQEKIELRMRLNADLHSRIQAEADREGNPVAAFVRGAVIEKLDRIRRESRPN